jgi:hypothetical protein
LVAVALKTGKYFTPNDATPLDGIIWHLSQEYGGNVHDLGIVAITSSEPFRPTPFYHARNAADLKSDSFFISAYNAPYEDIPHSPNNWISYDFKDRRILPSYYAIRSCYWGGVNHENPRSWLLECSLNGSEWIEIDRHENNNELNEENVTVVFEVARREICRCIKLVNIGRNHRSNDALAISSLEIFGYLVG